MDSLALDSLKPVTHEKNVIIETETLTIHEHLDP